jgi:hypothetical protein
MRRTNLKTWCLLSVFLLTVAGAAAARPIYVDVDAVGTDDGSSWDDAYNYLQDALADANSNPDPNEIWVAEGTYTPDSNSLGATGNRSASFQLISHVAVIGGYAGYGEPNSDARDIDFYETVLSGDLDGNDVEVNDACDLPAEPNRAENSYHVVTGSGTDANAVLDGFIVTAGNANGSGSDRDGAGMYCSSGSPTVVNCTFLHNLADDDGGGIYGCDGPITDCNITGNAADDDGGGMRDCDGPITNCTIANNRADDDGGGMRSCEGPVTDCTISGNWANDNGGGMRDCDGPITDCNITGNRAGTDGGGMDECHGPTTDCTIADNWADDDGGGMDNCDGQITNCVITYNYARDKGGGLHNCDGTITNCAIIGNSAGADGGGLHDFESLITNCAIIGNSAGADGGGGYTNDDFAMTNCTLADNWAANRGGGLCIREDSSATLANTIFWGNTAVTDGNEIARTDASTVDVNYCDVRGGQTGIYNSGAGTVNPR